MSNSKEEIEHILNSDLDIILKLQTEGPNFLYKCYQYSNLGNRKYKIDLYHKMFINEDNDGLFEDGIKIYTKYLINTDTNLWDFLVETSNKKELCDYIFNIISESEKYEFNYRIDILFKLFSNNLTKPLIIEDIFWNNKPFIENLLNSIDNKNSEIWYKHVESIHNFIKMFLLDKSIRKKTRSLFISWFSELLNDNIRKINLDTSSLEDDDLDSDTFLVNLLGIIYIFWVNGVSDENIKKIDPLYLKSNECPMEWYDTIINSEEENYSFFTELTFITANCLRIAYIPLINRISTWNELLNKIELEINFLLDNGTFFSQVALPSLYKEKKLINDTLEEDKLLLNNDILDNFVSNYYKIFLDWLSKYDKLPIQMDDILDNMSIYYLHRIEYKNIMYKELGDFSIRIIKEGKLTRNPDIRYNYLKVLQNSFRKYTTENNNIMPKPVEYLETLLILHNDLDEYDGMELVKIVKKNYIHKVIESFFLTEEIDLINIFDQVLNEETVRTRKFINIILNDMSYFFETIDIFEEKINTSDKGSIEYIRYAKLLCELFSKMSPYYELFVKLFNSSVFLHFVIQDELLTKMGLFLSLSIKKFFGDYNMQFVYLNEEEINREIGKGRLDEINFKKIVFESMYIFSIIAKNKNKIIQFIIENDVNFNKEHYYKILDLLNNDKDYSYMKNRINELILKIKSYYEIEHNTNDIEYPDEFLDPLLAVPIENPVLLPNMGGYGDLFMERSVIVQHLLNKGENPFNRQKLSVQELESYNNKSEVIEELDKFKHRFNEWEFTQFSKKE
mgnify:CR=1 FL=1